MPRGRILAIDYGERRIGLAMSDPERIIASGLSTLTINNDRAGIDEIKKIIRDYEVSLVVIGIPFRPDGSVSAKGIRIQTFGDTLKSETEVPVTEWDESFSSVSAKELLIQAETKKKRRKKEKIDELAAVVILRDYMDQHTE